MGVASLAWLADLKVFELRTYPADEPVGGARGPGKYTGETSRQLVLLLARLRSHASESSIVTYGSTLTVGLIPLSLLFLYFSNRLLHSRGVLSVPSPGGSKKKRHLHFKRSIKVAFQSVGALTQSE